MKDLAELAKIREKMQSKLDMSAGSGNKTRVLVGLATCGIAAGARPVYDEIIKLVKEKKLDKNVSVVQTGCIGLCQYEPLVEILEPGKGKVTYIKMTADKAKEVVNKHLIKGEVIEDYTMAKSGLK